MSKELYEAQARLCEAEGTAMYHLHVFGDEIARRKKYVAHKGIEALHFYLVERYHWTPAQVKALNFEDLSFLFAEERKGWTLPKAAL